MAAETGGVTMQIQNKTPFFRRPVFYTVLVVLLSLLLAADLALAFLPTGGGAANRDFQKPETMESGERPSGEFREDFFPGEPQSRQPDSPLQRLQAFWIPVAAVLAVLDGLCIFLRVRTGKKRKDQAQQEAKVHISSDGQVHLVKKSSGRKHSPWWVAAPLAILLVLALVVQFISGTGTVQIPRTEASILTGMAETGTLSTVLPGSGTLTAEEGNTVSLVDTVEIEQWYVEDGDLVSQGEKLASVDRVSVMSAIASIQDTLETLDEALSACETETLDAALYAPVSGRVKEIYASVGTGVADTMYDRGALMVLSIDGLMAVCVDAKGMLSPGDVVIVTLPGGDTEPGKVESVVNGTAVVTLSDDGPAKGDTVTVSLEDGTLVGSGELYIHSELSITAFTGTVDAIHVSEGEKVSGGRKLMTLTDREYTGEYDTLLLQRAKLEEQMITLFRLYQEGFLTAPCDGMVSGVADYKAANLGSNGSGWVLRLLANAPGEDPDALYQNYVGMVTGAEEGALQLKLCPVPIQILDYSQVGGLGLSGDLMTEEMTYTPDAAVPVYTYTDGGWTAGAVSGITPGDTLLFAFSPEDGRLAFLVFVSHTDMGGEEEKPPEEEKPGEGEKPDSGEASGEGEHSGEAPAAGGSAGSGSGMGSGSMGAGGSASGSTAKEPEYTVAETEILTVIPQDTMTITITVDELDILSLKVGQSAQVTLDAMPGKAFAGTVTEIGLEGSNAGGNSKYTATVTIRRGENMLPGMNASVSVILDTLEGALLVPVDALTEQDGKTYLYTAYDEKSDTFTGRTEVTTGLSDGQQVQILSGLAEGDSYCYRYLDTVNYSVSSAQTGTFSFFSIHGKSK